MKTDKAVVKMMNRKRLNSADGDEGEMAELVRGMLEQLGEESRKLLERGHAVKLSAGGRR